MMSSSETESDTKNKQRNIIKMKTKNQIRSDDSKFKDLRNTLSSDLEESQCTLHLPTSSASY